MTPAVNERKITCNVYFYDNVVTVVFLRKINNENVKSYVQNDALHGALGQVCRQGLSVWHPLSV
jgi:hypothetical protein